ncbi:MAG TPA: BTAD domain-containing putative transcriptional regulator [Streptosporangiaceae bacterium]|nr:BTAD domain-containing putative transcriptional regulator [Streptosporangiaceae bacterium]
MGRGILALFLLAILLIGLPLALYRFGGSPIPARLPSGHQVVVALLHRDNGSLFIAAVRDVSWLAWLGFAIAVIAEVQAAMRRRRAPRLHMVGLQALAGKLVAVAALTFVAPPAVSLLASPAMAATVQPVRPAARADLTVQAAGAAHSQAHDRVIVVRPGDCLWTIAEHYLGSGDRYTQIVDLNLGHDMGNGQVFSDPSVIMAGWHLLLPDATGGGAAGHSGSTEHGPEHGHSDAGGHGAATHSGHLTSHPRFSHPHQAAGHTGAGHSGAGHAGAGHLGDPGVEDAGGPQAAGPEAQPRAASADRRDQVAEVALFTMGMLAGGAVASIDRLRHRQRQYRRPGRRIALPADPAGRRIEQRLRAAAHWLPAAVPDTGDARPVDGAEPEFDDFWRDDPPGTERSLLPAAAELDEPLGDDADGPARANPATLRDALRDLSEGIAVGGEPLPPIVGIHLTSDTLDVLLSAPAAGPPPAPFTIAPARQAMCWTVGLGAGPAGADAAPPVPGEVGDLLPGLFTAGVTEAGGHLLLDLEAMRVTSCDGPDDLIDRLLATAATELASSDLSGWYDLVLVGCDELEVLGRAERCQDLDEALDLLRQRARLIARRMDDDGAPDVRTRRLADPDDEDWGLTLLVSRVAPTPDQMARLLDLAEGPGGLAALVAGDTQTDDGKLAPAVFKLAPDPDEPDRIVATITLAYLGPQHQITVWPQTLTVAEYEALAGVFAIAAQTADVGAEAEPYSDFGSPPWIRLAAAPVAPVGPADADLIAAAGPDLPGFGEFDPFGPAGTHRRAGDFSPADFQPRARSQGTGPRHAAPSLNVKVLGQVEISGSPEPLLPKQAELVLALALHAPGGVSNSGLCSLLGPDADHPKPADSVRQLITRTRKRLGKAADGQEYIIHLGSGTYVPHGDLRLDWASFSALARSGRADRRPEDLRTAMDLVRGEPFADCYHWWIDVALIETIRAEIVDTADLLAQLELAAGDPRGAARAARAGLAAETAAEQLWRALMRAEHEAGNPEGVAAAWTGCLDAIAEIAHGGEPHPDTEQLFHQLTRGAPIGSYR